MWAVAGSVVRKPWKTFVVDWNWKAALLSAVFRAFLFAAVAFPHGAGGMRLVVIELGFRVLVGGFWGALLEAFRNARPGWLAGLVAAVLIPGLAHAAEFLALRAGQASHILSGMIASVSLSAASLIAKWWLMRRGMLLTGEGADSLQGDLRRLPRAVAEMFLTPAIAVRRLLRGRAV